MQLQYGHLNPFVVTYVAVKPLDEGFKYRVFETIHTLNKTKEIFAMRNKKVLFITQAAAIAALYVVLTLLANAIGLANGAIQVRFSEALTVLPFLTPAAIPGLAVGCFLSNVLTGAAALDIAFGTAATLIGAVGTYLLGKASVKWFKWLAPLPPIIANALIIPWVLITAYEVPDAYWLLILTVGAGEVISCGMLGTVLLHALKDNRAVVFDGSLQGR